MKSEIGWSCALALVGCLATGCSSSTSHASSDSGAGGPDSGGPGTDGGSSAAEGGSKGTDGSTDGATDAGTAVTDGGLAMCCNKLTDNTVSCTGDAMVNDECTCLPVPVGTDCTAALPDAGPIVTTCSGYSCCFTFDGGSCQCISPGDLASCYGAGAACSVAASANGATLATSCP